MTKQEQAAESQMWIKFVSKFAKVAIAKTPDIQEFIRDNELTNEQAGVICFWLSAQTLSTVFSSFKDDGPQNWHKYIGGIIQWAETKLSENFDDAKSVLLEIFEDNKEKWSKILYKLLKALIDEVSKEKTGKKDLKYTSKGSQGKTKEPSQTDLMNFWVDKYLFAISLAVAKEDDVIQLCEMFEQIPKDQIINLICVICVGYFFKERLEGRITTIINDGLTNETLKRMFETANNTIKKMFSDLVPAAISKPFKAAVKEVCDDHKVIFIKKAVKYIVAQIKAKK